MSKSKSNAHHKSKTGKARVTKVTIRGKATELKTKKQVAKEGTLVLTKPKSVNPHKVVRLEKRPKPLTVKRLVDIPYEGVVTPFKFKVSADGKTIKVSYKGGESKLVITNDGGGFKKPWRLDVVQSKESDCDDYDSEFYKTPYLAYLGGLADVWDIVAERINTAPVNWS